MLQQDCKAEHKAFPSCIHVTKAVLTQEEKGHELQRMGRRCSLRGGGPCRSLSEPWSKHSERDSDAESFHQEIPLLSFFGLIRE